MRKVFGRPGFRLVFAGLVASMLGDWLMMLVQGIWVKVLTGSSGAAGLAVFFMALPMLVAPLLSSVVDRFRRRPFLVVGSLASALLFVPLIVLPASPPLIYATAIGNGLSAVLLGGALNGLLTELLPEDELVLGNAALQTVKQGLRLVGPLAGAALFAAFGGPVVAAIDAASFVVAAAVIAAVRVPEERPVRESTSWLAEVTAGVRHLVGEPALRRGVLGLVIVVSAVGMTESIGFQLVDQGLHRPPEFLSVLVSAMGIGAVVGGPLAPRVVNRWGELGAIGLGCATIGIAMAAMVVPLLALILPLMALIGLGLTVEGVADTTLLQKRTPATLMGRVSAAFDATVSLPQTMSIALGALLVTVVDYRPLLVAVGTVIVAGGLYAVRGHRLTPPAVTGTETVDTGTVGAATAAAATPGPATADPAGSVPGPEPPPEPAS